MGMLERAMRREMYRRQQMARHRRRGGFWGPPPRRGLFGSSSSRYGRYGRHQRRSNVRVFGCCLPFPIGALALSAMGARLLRR